MAMDINSVRKYFSRYSERFPLLEIQILVPLTFILFLISITTSLQVLIDENFGNNRSEYFLWSLIPTSFYGLILYLFIYRTQLWVHFLGFYSNSKIKAGDIRKSRYAQTILVVSILFTTFGAFDAFSWWYFGTEWALDGLRISAIGLTFIVLALFVLKINNRFVSNRSRFLVAILFFITFAFSDSPSQTMQGRTLFFQIIPIIIAGFILTPVMSLITSIAAISALTIRAIYSDLGINSTAYLGLILIGLLVWLIADGLENALSQIEQNNLLLENKVLIRTRQLLEANKFKSKYLTHITHELQSPIIAFSLFLRKR